MALSNRARAERLTGTRETHTIPLEGFEVRSSDSGNTLDFKGYASLFNVGYEMYGGPDKGGWTEYVDPKAFERTLSAKPDVVLNINHGEGGTGLPLARTTSGTLDLRTDTKGLLPSATLDMRDPDVQALQVKVERGDVNQMSFAFRTIRQEWHDAEGNVVAPGDGVERRLLELSLDRGDVSIVTNGANPKTTMQLRGLDEAIALLSAMDPAAAEAEVRAWTDGGLTEIEAAHTLLGRLMSRSTVKSQVGVMSKCSDCSGSGMCADCGGSGYLFTQMNSADDEQQETGETPPADEIKRSTLSIAHARRLAQMDAR